VWLTNWPVDSRTGSASLACSTRRLRQKFRRDVFEPVPKGEFGGDLIQRVVAATGQTCGLILWEAKRTTEPLLRPP
jgi:hypothetical protein